MIENFWFKVMVESLSLFMIRLFTLSGSILLPKEREREREREKARKNEKETERGRQRERERGKKKEKGE